MTRKRRWTLAPDTHSQAQDLSARLGISPITAQILINRGFSADEPARQFLSPRLTDLHDPSLLPGCTHAAGLIIQAVHKNQKIVIYGDYDVDGITATSILFHALKSIGANVHTYIPHRIDEGYGLNADAIADLASQGTQLLITVDCGITALVPAARAAALGLPLIITDHHEWTSPPPNSPPNTPPPLPDVAAIVHPRLPTPDAPVPYPNPHLCGAGVAFKLAWAIGQAHEGKHKVSESFRNVMLQATALAALGTIADVVPLVGENRILAAYGLRALPQSSLPGIIALINSSNLSGKALDAYDVGFLLAPRLNAAGRMGHAALAVEMLTVAPPDRAAEIATYLEQQNRQRQSTEKAILTAALEQIKASGQNPEADPNAVPAIVVASADWHPGVVGIVASRLVDRFHRPALVLAGHDDATLGGSGRSIAGFHLAHALAACSSHLTTHGGHEMAAGLKLPKSNLPAFAEAFCAHAQSVLQPYMLTPELKLECDTPLKFVNHALVKELSRLGPFGMGNRRPLLACTGVELTAPPRRVGKEGQHIQLFLRQNGTNIKAVAFNRPDIADTLTPLPPGSRIDLAVEPTLNTYNGNTTVELEVRDVRIQQA